MSPHRTRVDIHWSRDLISTRNRVASAFSRDGRKDTTLDHAGSKKPTKGLEGLKSLAPEKRQSAMQAELAKLAKECQIRLDQMRGRHAVTWQQSAKRGVSWRRIAPCCGSHTATNSTIKPRRSTGASKPCSLSEKQTLPHEMERGSCKATSTPPLPKPPPRTVMRRPHLGNSGSPQINARLTAPTNPAAGAT